MGNLKIRYVENNNGKLFSFHRHDYKTDTDSEGNLIMIDGGFDYSRFHGKLKEGAIVDLMPEIREQFVWGVNYNKDGERLESTVYKKLCDITTSHLSGIIRHLSERILSDYYGKDTKYILYIFSLELEGRLNV